MTEDTEDLPTLDVSEGVPTKGVFTLDMSEGVPIKDVPTLSYVLYNMAAVQVDNAKRYQEAMKTKESAANKALQHELERRETEKQLEVERRETAIQIEKAKMETEKARMEAEKASMEVEIKRIEAEDKAQETIKMQMEFLKTPGGMAMVNAMGTGMNMMGQGFAGATNGNLIDCFARLDTC